jgi:elongation factor Ts
MECKKALKQANGDIDSAIEIMRKSGAAKASKKAGRIAAEGIVDIKIDKDNKTAIIIEVNSETDFVTKTQNFIDFVNKLSSLALKTKPSSIEDFLTQKLENDIDINEAKEEIIANVGENIAIRRVKTITGNNNEHIGHYKHGHKIAVLALLEGGDSNIAKDIAMHIAASNPECINEEQLPKELLEKEKEIFFEQAKKSGKPDNIIEKMIVGRLKKFVKDTTLYGQSFIKNPEISVADLLNSNNAKVKLFIRFEVGEGIDKKTENFSQEVMAQARL